jgi:hypothetical protein
MKSQRKILKHESQIGHFTKSPTFSDITSCSPGKANQHFGVIYHLHFQGQNLRQTRSQYEADSKQSSVRCLLVASFLLFSTLFDHENGGDMFRRNVICTRLHEVM